MVVERGNWSRQLDFVLSSVGFAVGLGNVWRFPYLAYRNGGGTGLAMVIISAVVCIYYNVIIAYAIYYMFVSFVYLDDDLPWANCKGFWATDSCRDRSYPDFTNASGESALQYHNNFSFSDLNSTVVTSSLFGECKKIFTSPAGDFWSHFILRIGNSSIERLGSISLKNVLTLALAWILVFVCLMKGIKSSGKVVYFTATFPYVILTVLLVRGLTLDGYMEGVLFYVVPKWEKLADMKAWGDAATQIFYSLGIGFGGLLTMASYNKFKNNCYRDAILVAVINCSTSVYAGFAIFSMLGHMAYVSNRKIEEVADSGPGLAFVAYPEGITKLPAMSLWSFLFFFMILTLGLDSQFAMMETVISGISDLFPSVLRKRKTLFTFVLCLLGFLLGIPQTTEGGIYVLTLMDWYSGSYNLMIVALSELICLMYVYGFKNFSMDIEMMVGFKPNYYWLATWLVITPAAIVFIIISGAVRYSKAYYGKYVFEDFAQGLGWMMVSLPLLAILIVGAVQMIRYGVPGCFRPQPSWGPAKRENHTGRYAHLNDGSDKLDHVVTDKDNGGHVNAAYGYGEVNVRL
ncbi:hypothetical protein C0Q70_05838 [Pomacea canaliculata]|uniref:Transporter n=1 Tax=Pomacea canaliculata TaxID=400727 RepID=A0A2T7PMD4_POMCA|nr:hypothetical protein C0Q70_05838 [Pomacea canaliculata]